jgi:hypothetical protein
MTNTWRVRNIFGGFVASAIFLYSLVWERYNHHREELLCVSKV